MRTLFLLLSLAISPLALAEEEPAYAKPELLVEVNALQSHLAGEKLLSERPLTIIDVRTLQLYQNGSIAGARHVDVAEWKVAFGDGTDAEAWSKKIAKVLADTDSTVVVCDYAISGNGSRAWWILKYWGVRDVRMLNGGFAAWKEADGQLVPPAKTKNAAPVRFQAEAQADRLATLEEVRAAIAEGGDAACLVDTRSDGEVAEGIIPTAGHLDWQELVDPETGKMRSAAQLVGLFDRVGFDPEQPAITYCRSGGRASVTAFAMELMGAEQVSNYYGSWNEWGKAGTGEPRE